MTEQPPCRSCGLTNEPGRDFCERCGEYISWAPTMHVAAVQAGAAPDATVTQQPGDEPDVVAPPLEPAEATVSQAPPEDPVEEALLPPASDPPAGTRPAGAGVAPRSPPVPAAPEPIAGLTDVPPPSGDASIVLAPVAATIGAANVPAVDAGTVLTYSATIRNESQIVDNYDIAVLGLPEGWVAVTPPAVFLVPLGSGRGESDATVQIDITPPREFRSTAGIWTFELIAMSHTTASVGARAIAQFEVKPFPAWSVEAVPVVKSGRLKARYRIAVRNDGNGEQDLWLTALEDSGRLRTRFGAGKVTLQPGSVGVDTLTLRARLPLPIGRAREHRVGIDAVSTAPPVGEVELSAKQKLAARAKEEGAKTAKGVKVGPKGVTLPKLKLPKFTNPLKKLKLDPSMLSQLRSSTDPAAPLTARQIVFRQKPLIPLWLIGLLLLALIAVAIYLLLPREIKVPDLGSAKDTFAAEKLLRERGLVLSQPVQRKRDLAPPGSVIEQTPGAGTEVDRGSSVSIVVAVGDRTVAVPRLKDLTRVKADERLRMSGLSLGETRPEDAADNFVVRSQIPDVSLRVARGTPVRVFLEKPKKKKKAAKKKGAAAKKGAAKADVGGKKGGVGGAGAASVTIPGFRGKLVDEYTATLRRLGLKPKVNRAIASQVENTVLSAAPKPGKKAKKGAVVTVGASAGPAQLAVQNGSRVRVLDPKVPTTLGQFPRRSGSAQELSYLPSGDRVVYRSGRRIFLSSTARGAGARRIYGGPDAMSHPSVAPDNRTIAMIRTEEGDGDLCFAKIEGRGSLQPLCLPDDGWNLDGRITWRTGNAVIVAGRRRSNRSIFGLRRYATQRPFTTNPLLWSGRTATNVETPGKGVLAAAFSPAGTMVALISNLASSNFQVVLAEPGDLALADGKPTGVAACDVAWSPDSKDLTIIQADAGCSRPGGKVMRLPVAKPKQVRPVASSGSSPTYRPVR